jgi:proline racemase
MKIEHPELSEREWSGSVIFHTQNASCFVRLDLKGDLHSKQQLILAIDRGKIIFDRSPCGTGTCGRLAQLYSQGLISMNQELVNESMIGTVFRGKVVAEAKVGSFDAIIPEVTGTAWITSISTQVFDPTDPYKNGFPSKLHPYYESTT